MKGVDETRRRQFESDWLEGSCKDIAEYLPDEDSAMFLPTLEELICIDLEYRWRNNSTSQRTTIRPGATDTVSQDKPLLENYLDRFPQLKEPVILQRLVDQEIWVRKHSQPPPTEEEYVRRFPELHLPPSTFRRALTQDRALAQTTLGMQAEQNHQSPQQIGKYRILDIIGRGGMGKVYRAQQERTDRTLAIKVTRLADLDEDIRQELKQRFENEMRAAARVSHDHLMPVYDVGEADGCLFYTMPILDGDLAGEIRQRPLSNEAAAKYLSQAARGVEAAHASGLLHRDLKPHNLLLDREKERVLIADFGLARIAADRQELTQDGDMVGTLPYMSPEQIEQANKVDARADIYALGATLYHLLVGRPPFHAATPAETMRQILHDDPISPRLANPQVDRDLETITLKCLQKDASLRFQSAGELADELQRYLEGRPIRSRPLSPWQRLLRWRKRNPKVALLTLVLFFSLLLTASSVAIGMVSVKKQLTRVLDNNQQSQRILNDLFTFVRNEPLLNTPGQESVRKHLLTQGIAHYESLIALAEENETLPADLLAARAAHSLLTLELEGPEKAVESFRRAIAYAESLPKKQRQSLSVQRTLGDCWNGLGKSLHKAGKRQQALAALDRAVQIRKDISDKSDGDREAKRKLANALMNRGLVLAALGKREDARTEQNEAQRQRSQLLAESKKDPKLLRDFAQGQFNLARIDLLSGQRDRGAELLLDATDRFEKLTSQYPADALLWQRYIECLVMQDLVHIGQTATSGLPAEDSEAPLLRAIAYLRPLVMLAPANRAYRMRLIGLYQQAIERLLAVGNVQSAENVWQVTQEKLIDRLDEHDSQIDALRVRLLSLKQSGLIALGQGNRKLARVKLLAAISAWETAKSHPDFTMLKAEIMEKEWTDLKKLADSLEP